MAGTRTRPRARAVRFGVLGAGVLGLLVVAGCDTRAQFEPSLPPAAGFRVDNGVLKLWTGTPCTGVIRLRLIFDVGTQHSAEQVWTAAEPGVTLERMDLVPSTGGDLRVQTPLPAGYDWTTAAALNLAVDGPTSNGVRLDVTQLLRESAQHPSGSYLFGDQGWMDTADVQRQNRKSFLTMCTPDPA